MRNVIGIVSKVIIVTIFVLSFLFQGCSSTISLSRSPSDLVLLTIKPNNNDKVNYSFDSKIVEPFEYKGGGKRLYFHINTAMKNNIETYMQTKFSKLLDLQSKNDSICSIKYELKNFEVAYIFQQSTGDAFISLFQEGTKGNAIVDVKLTVFVNVSKNGETISEKNVISTSKYSEYLKPYVTVESIFEKAVNDGISKCIIMIDKYLVSIDL
jgi:hypothetical protein